ncbi:hypothetical protein AB0H45_10945 [Streptomyces atroolivaceus]|uniref:hypothetical protein n=1 Tax=Streptomyces atroolivaceus TaxID=66869 RepID=UPI0033F3A245
MTLARAFPDSTAEWWIYLGVLVLYLLTRWFLAWRQARKEGAEHPVRTAIEDEDAEETNTGTPSTGSFSSYRQLMGFVGGAIVIVLVAALTEGGLQLTLMCTLVPVIVVLLAYLDFRRARTQRLTHRHT